MTAQLEAIKEKQQKTWASGVPVMSPARNRAGWPRL